MNKPKMQHCEWCGKELGIYISRWNEPESCGKQECEREIRRMVYQHEYDREERAREDHFERY